MSYFFQFFSNVLELGETKKTIIFVPPLHWPFCPSSPLTMYFFQPFHLKMSGSLLNSASACPSSALSSTAKCVKKSPHTNCAATKGTNLETQSPQGFYFSLKEWQSCKNMWAGLELCCRFSLQELLHSSRKLSLKVLSFVQSFQVKTLYTFTTNSVSKM